MFGGWFSIVSQVNLPTQYFPVIGETITDCFFVLRFRENADKVPANDRKTLHHAVETNRQTMLNKNKPMDIAKLNITEFGSRFDKYEIDRFLAKMAQIHLILEHIILMQVNLNLDHTICRTIVGLNLPKNLVDFSRLKTMKSDKREFAIAANALLKKVEK